jgi:hypothetical protein
MLHLKPFNFNYTVGTGTCKGLVFSPASLSFPRQPLGTTSAPKTVTATNAFPLSVTVGSITTSGDFAQTNNCATVAPGATCNANITFNPTHPGTRHGTLTFDSNAPASPQTVGLTGAATDISLSPTRLNFGTYPVGTASAPKTVTVTNVGSTVVTFTAIGIKGTDPQDFVISNNNCPSLAPGASCPVSVEFKPTAAGTRTATLEFSDNGGASPQTVSLTGKGTNISLAPARLNFGNHPVGSTSATRTITVTNAGAVTVNFTGSPGITGTDPQDFSLSSGTCGASLAAGASCTIGVRFAPTATGARIATLSVFDDDAGSPQTAVLFGTGT